MSEKMLVTQALDERDLLVKKIADKIAKARDMDFNDRWEYYVKNIKNNNAWLSELMGKKNISFYDLCKEINEDEIYTDYGNASSYIHGQDITTKVCPFTFYSSIYIKLYLMIHFLTLILY